MNGSATALDEKTIVESAWQDQAIWSETAGRLKAALTGWRNLAAIAGVAGAVLETAAGTLPGFGEPWRSLSTPFAISGAVFLAVVPFVVKTKASGERMQEWVRARSVSEALKESIYRYLLGAIPFGPGSPPAELIKRCEAIKQKVPDLAIHAASAKVPKRKRPATLTMDDYVSRRVMEQVDGYYRPKGLKNALRAKWLHNVEFGLGLAAVVMGALASAGTSGGHPKLTVLAPWIAIVTTASAAVTAHLAAARYDHQAITYYATANRLVGIRNEWLAAPDRYNPARVAAFVDACEHAISTENESWMADWTSEQAQT